MTYPTSTIQSIEYSVEDSDVEYGYQYDPEPTPTTTAPLEYYHTQEFKDSLLTQLANLPEDYRLVAIRYGIDKDAKGHKAPIGNEWQQGQITREEIAQLIKMGKAWGFGILLGGEIMALDVDGNSAKAGLLAILAGRKLPKTVRFTSGKPGRSQYLFRVPAGEVSGLKKKAAKFDSEELDFRGGLDAGLQSCLPSTFHSLQYGTYSWVKDCSPADTDIAYLPDYLLDYWKSLINPVKKVGANTRKPKTSATPSLPSGKNNENFEYMLATLMHRVSTADYGSQNSTLNTAAGTLAGLFPEREEDIRIGLTAAMMNCEDPADPAKIAATVNSGIKFGIENPLTPNDEEELPKMCSLKAGKLLADEVLSNHKFDTLASQWMEYDGKGKWNPVGDSRIFKLVQDYLSDMVQIPSPIYLDHCIRFAKSHVHIDGWSEMSSLQYLPFTNGVLDIKANQFLPHSPDYLFTWQLPRDYSPTLGEWSQIDRFLDTLANNDSGLKQLAIAFCNAVLKGRSDLQKCPYLFGSGANGKGAFMNLLQMLIGSENVHSTNMSVLNTNQFESANLKGKRLVVMPDEDKYGGKLDIFKAAIGGDPIRFERKGKDASIFRFKGLMVIAANKPTFLGNSDGGIARRIVSFPCTAFIPEYDRVDMTPLFDADLTAFTSHLLSLDDVWVEKTIRQANTLDAVKELSQELAIRGNSVAAFYHEMLEPIIDGRSGCSGLYEAYREYCQGAGVSPKSLNNFTPDLVEYCNTSLGLAISKVKGREGNYLLGIKSQAKRG